MALILSPPSLPAVFHAMATVPNIAVSNSMACIVFRNIRFGRISEHTTYRGSTMNFVAAPRPRVGVTTTTTTDLESAAGDNFDVGRNLESKAYDHVPMTVMVFPPGQNKPNDDKQQSEQEDSYGTAFSR